MSRSSDAQRRLYHTLKSKLGKRADGLLKQMTGKGSCVDVSHSQLDLVLDEMKKMLEHSTITEDSFLTQSTQRTQSNEGAEIIPIPRQWIKE